MAKLTRRDEDELIGTQRVIGYEEGDGRVVFVGHLPEGPYGPGGRYAVIEFPSGPPPLKMSVVWDGTPVTICEKQPIK